MFEIIILILLIAILANLPTKEKEDKKTINKDVVLINQRTRGPIGTWKVVGIVYSESTSDNNVFNLTAREIDRNKFEYRITNNETGVLIQLFDGKEVNELSSGDTLTIPGYEGNYIVSINATDEFKYIPYIY